MTNLDALSAAVNYPVDTVKLSKILIDHDINELADYAGISKQFELATADLYVLLVSSVSISEGGYQISMTDKSNMIVLAGAIFNKYNMPNPLKPKAVIRNRSNYW